MHVSVFIKLLSRAKVAMIYSELNNMPSVTAFLRVCIDIILKYNGC